MASLVTEEDLRKWTGFEQRAKLEAWLRENRICYTYGKGNMLITTMAAVNRAIAGEQAQQEDAFF